LKIPVLNEEMTDAGFGSVFLFEQSKFFLLFNQQKAGISAFLNEFK